MKHKLFAIALSAASILASHAATDYTKGIIYVNEDWYGHHNSTLNHLSPDDPDGNYWTYRIFQAENPGHELGCTNQYGAIWHGRLYLIAKQERDPGADITGGRITVADATTLEMITQLTTIDPSGAQCDGRGFLGVNEQKGYVSTSNGVWVLDLKTLQITGRVEGSQNPNAGGDNDKPNDDPTGALYHGQCGMMVRAAGRVFVAHQQYGLLVVDPERDKVVETISLEIVQPKAAIGSIVKSKDGMLWVSVAKDATGMGTALDCLVRVDPATLATEVVNLPEGVYGPANSWYAWTPDSYVGSKVNNVLYWKGGKNRWFSGTKIFRFDCDTRECSLLIDLEKEGANWNIYGCSMGIHPLTDEIYMALYHQFGEPTYITRRYNSAGEKIKDYEMIRNYWFPSLPLFPEAPETDDIVSGLSDPETAAASIEYAGGVLTVKGNAGERLEIYNLSGVCAYSRTLTSPIEIISPDLPKGLYIARTPGATAKFAVR